MGLHEESTYKCSISTWGTNFSEDINVLKYWVLLRVHCIQDSPLETKTLFRVAIQSLIKVRELLAFCVKQDEFGYLINRYVKQTAIYLGRIVSRSFTHTLWQVCTAKPLLKMLDGPQVWRFSSWTIPVEFPYMWLSWKVPQHMNVSWFYRTKTLVSWKAVR